MFSMHHLLYLITFTILIFIIFVVKHSAIFLIINLKNYEVTNEHIIIFYVLKYENIKY